MAAKKKQNSVASVPTENPKRKVAIVRGRDIEVSYNYGDDYYQQMLAHSISDWVEVTEEQYQILKKYSYTSSRDGYKYFVIEQLTPTEVVTTIDEYLAFVAKEEEQAKQRKKQEEKAKAEREAKKREKQLAKVAKSEAEQRKLFEELKEKFG